MDVPGSNVALSAALDEDFVTNRHKEGPCKNLVCTWAQETPEFHVRL